MFEHVGQATFSTSLYVCAKMGRVVVCGATSGYDVGFDARHLWMRQKSIIGSHFANGHDAERANRLVIAGRIRPVLTRVFPYCQTPEALTAQADPSHCGKLAVLVQADAEASGRDGLGTTRSIGDLVDHLR